MILSSIIIGSLYGIVIGLLIDDVIADWRLNREDRQ